LRSTGGSRKTLYARALELKDATDRQSAQRRGHRGETVAALWLAAQGLRILRGG